GVRAGHAYMCFDGRALFVQSTDDQRPAICDGHPLARGWTELAPPCAIDLGAARLVYRVAEAADEELDTTRQPNPARQATGAGAGAAARIAPLIEPLVEPASGR